MALPDTSSSAVPLPGNGNRHPLDNKRDSHLAGFNHNIKNMAVCTNLHMTGRVHFRKPSAQPCPGPQVTNAPGL
jgi:hypothetical protein